MTSLEREAAGLLLDLRESRRHGKGLTPRELIRVTGLIDEIVRKLKSRREPPRSLHGLMLMIRSELEDQKYALILHELPPLKESPELSGKVNELISRTRRHRKDD